MHKLANKIRELCVPYLAEVEGEAGVTSERGRVTTVRRRSQRRQWGLLTWEQKSEIDCRFI